MIGGKTMESRLDISAQNAFAAKASNPVKFNLNDHLKWKIFAFTSAYVSMLNIKIRKQCKV